ncbi:MAG TPA: DoxX family protein [Rhizobiaceae bacterium]|jgi:putative oxidoreductase|nr:DoxX family protein [Rhizobiaceae bacterium]
MNTFYALGVLRIITALLFIEHGTQKLFGFPASAHGSPVLFSLMGLAGILEAFGGLLVLIGFKTRYVAFILSGEMAVAYWTAHAPRSFFPVNNSGDAAVLFCFLFLFFVFAGAGAWSLDARSASPREIGVPAE